MKGRRASQAHGNCFINFTGRLPTLPHVRCGVQGDKTMRKLLVASILTLLALNLACHKTANTTNHNAGAKATASDSWITTKTKLALIADKRTSGFATDVDARNGIVTLSGKVDTAQAKSAATEVAGGIAGVKSVDNQLQVVPDARRKEVAAADDRVEDAVKNAFK